MAPEYAMHGYLPEKVDVYSFGIVALEIVHVLRENKTLANLVDRKLGLDFKPDEVMVMTTNIALICTNVTATARPTMSSVVSMLEDIIIPQELLKDLDSIAITRKLKMMNQQKQTDVNTEELTVKYTDSGRLLTHGSQIELPK
ncbi:probable LRR receptor-like serine/threonine-protein kinase At1g07650 [Impatiens glandulifera]|uniref:probable LRR receptor-like serine/threonine-protein kinase At1g07650 n=1 Tax=Impatiens glandulifera TaxID=253017 RepID=UPI001FB14F44|nr:probable LRR receptor-like serine/threonine-protein kinase At1g07650 [Impatiens glandulifera]